ncbi:gamma-glutamylcyclotransferase [Xanthomonas phage DES1]|nr:gamma-glutamylcyclotransferase [Xanthomonas phage DES1]
MTTLHKVFTYGTLRAYSDSPDATHMLCGYEMYDYGKFPYLLQGLRTDEVYGNILAVDDAELAELDMYEGIEAGLYTREEVVAWDLYLKVDVKCFVYVQKKLHPKKIESGDWHRR